MCAWAPLPSNESNRFWASRTFSNSPGPRTFPWSTGWLPNIQASLLSLSLQLVTGVLPQRHQFSALQWWSLPHKSPFGTFLAVEIKLLQTLGIYWLSYSQAASSHHLLPFTTGLQHILMLISAPIDTPSNHLELSDMPLFQPPGNQCRHQQMPKVYLRCFRFLAL